MKNSVKTLHLTLKKQWFDMILSGEKKEEYREIKPYWNKRFAAALLDFKHCGYNTITFSLGYKTDRPQMTVEWNGIFIREGKPEWGGEPGTEFYVLELGEILNTKNVTFE